MSKYITVLLWFVFAPCMAGERSEAVIVLKDRVSIDRAEFNLSDIADIQTNDIELRSRLEQVRVGSAPTIGTRRTVQRDDILRLLSVMDDRPLYRGLGATRTIVERGVRLQSSELLIEKARAFALGELQTQHPTLSRIDVSAEKLADIRVPTGDIVLKPRLINANHLAKRICVWVDVLVNDKSYRSVPVWLSVQAYAPVVVAQRDVAAREALTLADVSIEERDIAGIGRTALVRQQDVVSHRARSLLTRGAIIRVSDVEINPSVLKDQEVDVQVTTGSVQIKTKAVAQEEGHFGSIIRVRNPSSTLVYRARVIGDRAVAAIDGEV